VTLLVAPAGFGKTTLLAEWCASDERGAVPTAWVSLDADDNDPARFWAHLVAAADRLHPGAGELPAALLAAPAPPPIETVLGALVNALADLPDDAVLVLDDYHMIDAQPVHRGITYLLEHLPHRVHLALLTRADPPLPLARLRGRGELTEIRAADLRFLPEEAAAFLEGTMGLRLEPDQAATLEARTEGWAAGLQLAGLALRGHADPAGFVAGFAGSDRFVVDYLAEEVLRRQPAARHDFMCRTSILARLCGPLCDAVLAAGPDGVDSQARLEELERANLFVIPLDRERRWYRYHQLFAEVLRARLQASVPAGEVADLHRRASTWYADQGQLVEAIGHALAGGAADRAAALIERVWHAESVEGVPHYAAVGRWVATLPPAQVRDNPVLCVARAGLLLSLVRFEPDQAEAWIADAERALGSGRWSPSAGGPTASDVAGAIAWARALLAGYRGDAAAALAAGREALAHLAPDNVPGRCYVAIALCAAHTASGDLARAEASVAEAVGRARDAANGYFTCLSAANLVALQRARGAVAAAAATGEETLAWSARTGPGGRAVEGMLLMQLADLHRERNDLDAALACATEAATRFRTWGTPDTMVMSAFVLARVRQARGELEPALALCADLAGRTAGFGWLAPLVAALETQVRLAQALAGGGALPAVPPPGRPTEDRDLRARPRLLPYAYEHVWIAPAQVLLARGRALGDGELLRRALAELGRLEGDATRLPWLRIKCLVLRGLAHHALGDEAAAAEALRSALALAQPDRYVRVFADEGPPMAALLGALPAGDAAAAYLDELRRAAARQAGAPWPEPGAAFAPDGSAAPRTARLAEALTGREVEVLRLIAAGRSNDEIARALVVAASTVKTHVNNVYGKLGVARRTEAVARARELGLL
jgi:LuxR family maltose regulon positive regulatory protein